MEKYMKVYTFELMSRIAEDKTVYMLDRMLNEVFCVNNLPVSRVLDILKKADQEGRFDFWYIETEETSNA